MKPEIFKSEWDKLNNLDESSLDLPTIEQYQRELGVKHHVAKTFWEADRGINMCPTQSPEDFLAELSAMKENL